MSDDDDTWTVDRLSALLGLDVESIESQLLPQLKAQKSADAAKNHLLGLLGHGPEVDTFVSEYTTRKYAVPPPQTVARISAPTSGSQKAKPNSRGHFISDQRARHAADSSKQVPSHTTKRQAVKIKFTELNPESNNISEDQIEALLYLLSLPKASASSKKRQRRRCFCHARIHPLSKLTPICFNCGLPLCMMHRPHYDCPFCERPVLTAENKDGMVAGLLSRKEDLQALKRAEESKAKQMANASSQAPSLATAQSRGNYAGKAGGPGSLPSLSDAQDARTHFPAMQTSKGKQRNTAVRDPTTRVLSLDRHGRASLVREPILEGGMQKAIIPEILYNDSDDEGMIAVTAV